MCLTENMVHLLPVVFAPVNFILYFTLIAIWYFLFVKKNHIPDYAEPEHVVVVGGGFAGVAAILKLRKYTGTIPVKITLIDKNTYHLFTPSLYEVATSEEPKKNVTIPFSKIFPAGVQFIHDTVQNIDTQNSVIKLKTKGDVPYDYLILTAGSQPAFMGIPGLEKYGTGFKTLQDALTIKKQIRDLCCKDGKCDKKVQVLIGGGGFAGSELAAELLTYKDRIAVQNGLDKNCLEMSIIQGSDHLLKELNPKVSQLAEKRLDEPNVHFAFGGHIKEVTKDKVLTDNGKSYPYEILIWTGGVTPNSLAMASNLPVTHHRGLVVNNYLQVKGFDNIFAAGDVADFMDPVTLRPAPNVAQVAEEQGASVGRNVAAMVRNGDLRPYYFRHWGYVVPLKGYFAASEFFGSLHINGFAGWILQQMVLLRYLFGILPWWRALERFDTFEMEMEK
jgi:NADH:quinone reductase (non-electrogenic)